MPPVIIGAVAATAATAAATALVSGLAAVTTALLGTTFVATLVLGGVSYALTPKPKAPDLAFRDRTLTVRQPTAPWRVIYGRTRVGGTYALVHTTNNNSYLHLVIVLAGHECAEIGDIYFDDEVIPLDGSGNATGRYAGYVRIKKYLGTADQVADPDLIAEAGDKWTVNHRLRGRAYIYVRLRWNQDLFVNGVPNITAVVKGRKVYDPRTGTTAWSDNPALCLADYLTNKSFGLGADYATEIDETALIEAANVCDEDVPLADGGSEKRYTCNGSFDTDQAPKAIIEGLLTSLAGKAVLTGGKWRILAGAYRTPTITLTEDDLRAGFKVQTRVSRRENFNAVKGVFVSPDNKWQPSDFPAVESDTYMAEDNGERVYKDINLPWTISASMAQRLAKIELLRARQQITTVWPCKLSAYRVQTGDVVNLSYARLGWHEKPFEVVGTTLTPEEDDQDNVYLGVDLSLRETAPNVYDWSASEEQPFDAAPDTNLPNPFTVLPPGAPEVTESLYETRDSAGVKAKATLTWVASADAFVREYQPEYKLVSASDWTVLSRTPGTTADILDIAPGIYDFRVKAINDLGVSSEYSTTRKEILGLGAPPAAVTNLRLQAISAIAILQWDLHPDLDVRIGGRIEFRHSEATSGATWAQSIRIGEAAPGNATMTALPLKAGTYLARAFDSSGIPSQTVATVVTTAADVLNFSTIGNVQEDPDFLGEKTNVFADDGELQLLGSGLFDDIEDFDAVGNLDAQGGVVALGTYVFAGGIDLGSVKSVRLRPTISALIANVSENIDDRTKPVDEWSDWDGTDAADCDAVLYVRQTDDDPSGSPSWSEWTPLVMGDYRARAFQFKLELLSNDPAYNILISELRVQADEVA